MVVALVFDPKYDLTFVAKLVELVYQILNRMIVLLLSFWQFFPYLIDVIHHICIELSMLHFSRGHL